MHIWLYFLFGDNFRRSKKVLLYYSLQPYRNDFIIEALMDIEKNQKRLTFWLRFSSLKKKICFVLLCTSLLQYYYFAIKLKGAQKIGPLITYT